MIEQASLVIGEGNWAVKSDSLLGYKINGGKYYPREMSVVRATTGTRINEDGLVEVVPYNLVQYSQEFNNGGYWALSNATITANNTTAPDGTMTADKVVVSANTDNVIQTGLPFVGVGNSNTISLYIKGSGSNIGKEVGLYIDRDGGGTYEASTVVGVLTAEWQRIEVTHTWVNSQSAVRYKISQAIVTTPASEFFIWGAQIVEGSSALDYLPTTDRLDVARIDYSSGSGALLVEPQRTNLALYSSSFDNGSWDKAASSVTANQITSPSGVQDADKLIENSANEIHGLYNLNPYTSITTATTSLFFKKGTRKFFSIKLQIGANSYTQIYDSESVTTTSNSSNGLTSVSSSIVDFGNGWVRATLTGTNPSGAADAYTIYCLSDSATPTFNPVNFNPTYQGTGTDYGYIWGAQLEAGSYPTSLIPTQGSTVTRNADVISKTGIADLIGQTEGTIFWDINVDILSASGHEDILNIDNGAFGNTIYFFKGSNATFTAEVYNASVQQCSFSTPIPAVGRYKLALAYKTNDFAFYVNGVYVSLDTSGSVGAMSRMQLGQGVFGPSTGYTNAVALYKTRLTNAQLATLTTI